MDQHGPSTEGINREIPVNINLKTQKGRTVKWYHVFMLGVLVWEGVVNDED
jgi:hypothetical protein